MLTFRIPTVRSRSSLLLLTALLGVSLACGSTVRDCKDCGASTADDVASGGRIAGAGGASLGGALGEGTGSGGGDGSCSAGESKPGASECDPDRGVIRTCNECGKWALSAELCVRELAMDQESNVACAVHGKGDLTCFSTSFDTSNSTKILRDFRSLILPDDATNWVFPEAATLPLCTLSAEGVLECDRRAGQVSKTGCSSASVSDQGGEPVCGVCGGEAFCVGAAQSPPKSAQSFALADGTFSYIKEGAIFDLSNTPKTFSGLRDIFRANDGTLCAFDDSLSGIRCVTAEGDTVNLARDLVEASVGDGGFVCGVDANGTGSCAFLDEGDASPEPIIELQGIRHFRASSSVACALSLDGHVSCYDTKGAELSVPEVMP